MKIVLVLGLLMLAGCSRGTGVYTGKPVDVSWEGWFFKSCEVEWKTSEESSKSQYSSTRNYGLCTRLQASPGKTFRVRWRHYMPNFTTDTRYLIESVEELK